MRKLEYVSWALWTVWSMQMEKYYTILVYSVRQTCKQKSAQCARSSWEIGTEPWLCKLLLPNLFYFKFVLYFHDSWGLMSLRDKLFAKASEQNLTHHSHSLRLTGTSWREWPHATSDSKGSLTAGAAASCQVGRKASSTWKWERATSSQLFCSCVFAEVAVGIDQQWSTTISIPVKDCSLEGYDKDWCNSFSTMISPEKEPTYPYARHSGTARALP